MVNILIRMIYLSVVLATVHLNAQPNTSLSVLRSVIEVRNLTRDQAIQHYPVKVTAMVTHWNPASLDLFVEDETGGIFVAANSPVLPVVVGEWMEITGVSSQGGYNRVISRPEFVRHDKQRQPLLPTSVQISEVLTGKWDCRWVEVTGVVQSIINKANPLVFWLRSNGQKLQISVTRIYPDFDPIELLNAEISVRGVCSTSIKANGELDSVQLLVNGIEDLNLKRKDHFDIEQFPVLKAADLSQGITSNVMDHAVCMKGRLVRGPMPDFWRLEDQTGSVLIRSNEVLRVLEGYETKAAGFLMRTGSGLALEDTILKQYAVQGRSPTAGATNTSNNLVPIISDIGIMNKMPPVESDKGYPVYIRGIVTVVDAARQQFCLQDDTGGAFIVLPNDIRSIKAGKVVDVYGVTGSGTFMPVVKQTIIRVVGERPMPTPLHLSYADLLSGSHDGRWVSLEGVIRTSWKDRDYISFILGVNYQRITVRIPKTLENADLTSWIDAKARIIGVLDVEPNLLRQPKAFGLLSPDLAQVTIQPLENRTESPLQKIREIGRIRSEKDRAHRVRTQGVITHCALGLGIFLRDETGSILVRIQPDSIKDLSEGDLVEVAGFIGRGDYAELIEDSTARKLATGQKVRALDASIEDAIKGIHDYDLIRVEGEVINHYDSSQGERIILQTNNAIFEAQLNNHQIDRLGKTFRPSTKLAVIGLCMTETDINGSPRGFRLLVRSEKDIAVVQWPSWWTVNKILWIAAVLVVIATAAFGWVAALKKQVHKQTQATKETLALFEASLAQSPSGIIIAKAPDMLIRWANPAALEFCTSHDSNLVGFGLTFAHWQGFRIDGTPYQPDQLPLARAILNKESTCNEEFILRNSMGADRWVSVNAAPIRDEKGTVIAGIMVFHDITNRKQAEEDKEHLQEQLLQSQKMESVGRLAGGVAHDFNNMLQVIIGNASLAMDLAPSGDFRNCIDEIHKAAEHSADLTKQLLAFARKQIVSPKVLDLNQAVSQSVNLLRRLIGENIDLVWIPGLNVWPVMMDLTQLDQVLTNLTVNARDAIKETGSITIETSNVVLDENFSHTHAESIPGKYVMLVVSDSGIGMSKDTQAHLFEPFFTTKDLKKGTGLGLATIYGIVKQNNGIINVYSELGKGTTFKIYLPRAEVEFESAEQRKPPIALHGTESILMIEDEEQVLKFGQRVLSQHGYKVYTAGSPGEALALVSKEKVSIDLMITDVIMPTMNGKELMQQISEKQPGIKCLFMSGYTANVIAHHGVLDDGIAFLQKPFSVQALTEKVREVLSSKHSSKMGS